MKMIDFKVLPLGERLTILNNHLLILKHSASIY